MPVTKPKAGPLQEPAVAPKRGIAAPLQKPVYGEPSAKKEVAAASPAKSPTDSIPAIGPPPLATSPKAVGPQTSVPQALSGECGNPPTPVTKPAAPIHPSPNKASQPGTPLKTTDKPGDPMDRLLATPKSTPVRSPWHKKVRVASPKTLDFQQDEKAQIKQIKPISAVSQCTTILL